MTQQEFIKQFQELNNNFYNSSLAEDYIDSANSAREILGNYIEDAQESIDKRTEWFIDSFGGEGRLMRNLKGE